MTHSATFRTFVALACAALASAQAPSAHADTPAVSIQESSIDETFVDTTVGWSFTLKSAVDVTELGFNTYNTGHSLVVPEQVNVFSTAGTLLAAAAVPAGIAASSSNGYFLYVPITPVLLPAGTYTIASFVPAQTNDLSVFGPVTPAAGITYNGSRSEIGGSYTTDPTGNDLGASNGYFGPNFQFNPYSAPTPPPAAPEPSTWAMMFAGTGLLVLAQRFRRTSAA